jgi:hypothetical protein
MNWKGFERELPKQFPGENWGKNKKIPTMMNCILPEIRSKYLPNPCVERYHYASPFCG